MEGLYETADSRLVGVCVCVCLFSGVLCFVS